MFLQVTSHSRVGERWPLTAGMFRPGITGAMKTDFVDKLSLEGLARVCPPPSIRTLGVRLALLVP